MFTNVKDKTPKQNMSNVVYEFTCQKCSKSYIGKTERTLLERGKEHAYKDNDSAVKKHSKSCYSPEELKNKTNKDYIVDLGMVNYNLFTFCCFFNKKLLLQTSSTCD